jgi:hypothetical protein
MLVLLERVCDKERSAPRAEGQVTYLVLLSFLQIVAAEAAP